MVARWHLARAISSLYFTSLPFLSLLFSLFVVLLQKSPRGSVLIDWIIYKGKVWISANPCPVVFSSVPWSNFQRIVHGSLEQPYSSTRMEMWSYHDNTEKRTYLVEILGDNLCETIVPRSELAVKTWKDICHLFHCCCKHAQLNIYVTTNIRESKRKAWNVRETGLSSYLLLN